MFTEESEPNHTTARAAAIRWARQILTQDFVVLDTETTGLGDTAGAHGAAADCRMTLAVVRAMAESELGGDGPAAEP